MNPIRKSALVTFHIHTYGCQMNVRDSEAVMARLIAAGHRYVEDEKDADLVIVNTCSVREKAEDKAIGKLRLLCVEKRVNPRRVVGVMGCMSQRIGKDLFKLVKGLDFAVGSREADKIVPIVKQLEEGVTPRWAPGDLTAHDAPCEHVAPGLSAFVTILLGCNRHCSYCIVPDVRGAEYSRPAADVIREVRDLVGQGVREVTLLGQSVLRYGKLGEPVWPDAAPAGAAYTEPFTRLLEALSAIPGLQRIRFTSGHPGGCTEELARAMRDLPPVCAHLHLPVQSGSDRVLKVMRRGYTSGDYLAAVERLRSYVPDCSITTDIIVGFPGETEEDFEATRDLMRKARFDNSFVFKFSPRPGTPAADEMEDDVTPEQKDVRNKILLADQDAMGLALNESWVGREVVVLAEGPSLRNAERWAGRSEQNKIVHFEPGPATRAGDLVRVKVTAAHPQTLFGELV